MQKHIEIYTDGSCKKNPGHGGYAALIIFKEEDLIYSVSGNARNTTNNRMELRAIIAGLESVTKKIGQGLNITIYSDSTYCIVPIIQKKLYNWEKFSTFKLKPNLDLWEILHNLIIKHNIECVKVKAHSDNKYNNFVDRLAYKAGNRLYK